MCQNSFPVFGICHSLIAQLVKNLPALQETPVRFLGWEDPRRDRLPTPVFLGFPCGSAGKESAYIVETWVRSLGWEAPLDLQGVFRKILFLEKGGATHSSIWPGEFHGLSIGSQRIGHD